MSQQEDDLRALAKIMDFLRAVSIILVVIHIYWYCYEAIQLWGINIGVVDRMLMNFQRTAGLFGSIILHQNICIGSPCLVVFGYDRRKGGEDYLEEDLDGTCHRFHPLLSQLVDIGIAATH